MREVAERRQQLEFEHEQALAILTFKQDEVKRLQRAQFAAKKEHEEVVQMLESTLDSMQAKVLELEEKCRNQSKQFSLLSQELERFHLQAETFRPYSSSSISDLDLYQLIKRFKDVEAAPSLVSRPLRMEHARIEQTPTVHNYDPPATDIKSASPGSPVLSLAPKPEILLHNSQKAFPPQGAHSVQQQKELNVHTVLLPPNESRTPPQVFSSRYSYNPYDGPNDNPDVELPLTAGEFVYIHGNMDNDGFYKGELPDGRQGLVPSTFVEPVFQHKMFIPPPAVNPFSSNYSQNPQCLRKDSSEKTDIFVYSADVLDVAFEDDFEETSAGTVPCPRRLTVIKQLAKSIIISWDPPLVPAGWGDILSYNIYVDKELRLNAPFGSQTKAVLERLDVRLKTYRISVQSVTEKGTSDQLRCSLLVGRDVSVAPTQLKVDDINSTSAKLTWLPSNSNYVHMVYLNGVDWQLVKAGTYTLRLFNLRPNQCYDVKVESHSPQNPWEIPQHQREHRSTTTRFTTLMAGPPDPPRDVRLEIGPSPGIVLISWQPVSVDAYGASNDVHVTGYTIYADKRKVLEVSSPTASSVMMGPSQIHILETACELTVRTTSPHGESADSMPAQVLPDLLAAVRLESQAANIETPIRNVSTLLRNPPLGAPANSSDQSLVIHRESSRTPEDSVKSLPPYMDKPLDSNKIRGSQQIPKREHQSSKIQIPPLPDIQEEEEPYSDNAESAGYGGKPNHCETDSDEEILERLMKLPQQAGSKKQIFKTAEVTEEVDNTEECVEPLLPSSPKIQQLGSRLQEMVFSEKIAPLPDRHMINSSKPAGSDLLARMAKHQDFEVSHISSTPRHYGGGDQSEMLIGCCSSIQNVKNKSQRKVHYSDIVQSISYQEEDSDYSVDAPIKEACKSPEKVHRSYHIESSHKGGDWLRRDVLQKSQMSSIQHSPGQYLGSKTVVRNKASPGSGMEINLEYGTEDDDESLLGDPPDIAVEQISSEWWLEGGHSELLQGFGNFSGRLNTFTRDGEYIQQHKASHVPQNHQRRGRMGLSGTDGSYMKKLHEKTEDYHKSYQLHAKFEQWVKDYSNKDDYQKDTYHNEGKPSATISSAQERLQRLKSLKKVQTKTGRLKGGLQLASPQAEGEMDEVFEENHARIFVALFPYDPAIMSPNTDTAEEELAFTEGQIIQIYGDKDADGFYYGKSNGCFGYIPSNMVSEVHLDDEETRQQLLQRGFLLTDIPVEKLDLRHSPVKPKGQASRRMVAIFDYDPQESSPNVDNEAELTFHAGDTILVFGDMDNDGFFIGELNGQQGLVPSNFLRTILETEDEEHCEAGKERRRTVNFKH